MSRWEKDASEPSASLFLLICKILGITDIYQEYYGTNPDIPWSELNNEGKAKVLEYIDLLAASGRYKNTTIIPLKRKIRLFDIPASTGTGNFLDDDSFGEIEVGEEVPVNADFGIRLTGDSMEPRFTFRKEGIIWLSPTI